MNSLVRWPLLLLFSIAVASCSRERSFSGTVQRVELLEGNALLHLPDNRIILAEWSTLVDRTDIMIGALNDRPVAAILEALQAWKGRYVTCTGEVKKLNGKSYMAVQGDRSNLIVH